MSPGKLILTTPLILVILVSGCIIPGTNIDIPFLPDMFGGGATVEYENDIIIIRSLTAIPDTIVPDQSTRLISYIQNLGNDKKENIMVSLYDYCSGLFEEVKVKCPGANSYSNGNSCTSIILLPGETKEVSWTLTADNIPIETSCDLKVFVQYEQTTPGITSITFINPTEMQRRIQEGTFTPITSYTTVGEGPIKPYLTVEDTQPISTDTGTTVLAFQIVNKGSGFMPGDILTSLNIHLGQLNLKTESNNENNNNRCEKVFKQSGDTSDIKLIDRESPKLYCAVEIADALQQGQLETTIHLRDDITYNYQFRQQVKVTVRPKMI